MHACNTHIVCPFKFFSFYKILFGTLEGKSPQGFSNAQNSRLI